MHFFYYSNSKIMVFFSWNSSNNYSHVLYRLVTSISKSWSVAFIVATFLLSHISNHVIHLFSIFSSNIFPSFLFLYLPTTFNFTVTLSSSFLYFDSSSPHSFCINLISFSSLSPYFFPHKTVSTLSLSMDFCSFFYL